MREGKQIDLERFVKGGTRSQEPLEVQEKVESEGRNKRIYQAQTQLGEAAYQHSKLL